MSGAVRNSGESGRRIVILGECDALPRLGEPITVKITEPAITSFRRRCGHPRPEYESGEEYAAGAAETDTERDRLSDKLTMMMECLEMVLRYDEQLTELVPLPHHVRRRDVGKINRLLVASPDVGSDTTREAWVGSRNRALALFARQATDTVYLEATAWVSHTIHARLKGLSLDRRLWSNPNA